VDCGEGRYDCVVKGDHIESGEEKGCHEILSERDDTLNDVSKIGKGLFF